MQKLDASRWKHGGNIKEHDALLLRYCQRRGGTTFANVVLDGDPYPHPRRIDAVRFPSRSHCLIAWRRREPKEFEEQLRLARHGRLRVEVIEVINGEMDRGTVGQVVVGGWLLQRYKVKVTEVVVCQRAITKLKRFFRKRNIQLWDFH
jgi:hypothetical protein